MKKLNKIYSGQIIITEGELEVTDPCYNKDVWCRVKLENVVNGTYDCYVYSTNKGKYGVRTAKIQLVLEGKDEEAANKLKTAGISKVIGVDSGMAGFFVNKPDFDDEAWQEMCRFMFGENLDEPGFVAGQPKGFYARSFDNGGQGIWASSGWGDGEYPVMVARDDEGQIIGAEVKFLPEDEL